MYSKQIWKFPLGSNVTQEIMMPENAQLLCVKMQNETPYIWAVCNTSHEAPKELRYLMVLTTGEDADFSALRYVDSFFTEGESLVFHVFEKLMLPNQQ